MKRKTSWLFAGLLAVIMVLSMLPIGMLTAFAADTGTPVTGETGQSGACSDTISWKYENGILTLSGKGALPDYKVSTSTALPKAPWLSFKDEIKEVVFGKGISGDKGTYAFQNCTALEKVTFEKGLPEEGLTQIANYMFSGCKSLKRITLPSTLKTIGDRAFEKCAGLEKLTLPEGLTKIGNNSFAESGLTEINIPGKVSTIGSYCFSKCGSLKTVELAEGVGTIGNYAFASCPMLEKVILPDSLKNIGNNTFNGDTSLKTVHFRGSQEEWEVISGNGKPTVPVIFYIEKQPQDMLFALNQELKASDRLSVTVKVPENKADASYEWYINDKNSTTGGTLVADVSVSADNSTSFCVPDTSKLGIQYYYCKISAKGEGDTVFSYTSATSKVNIIERVWEGSGTEAAPYLLSTPGDMQMLYAYVASGENAEGLFFRMTEDITLPDGWASIGVRKDPSDKYINKGENMFAFSGTLDGKNHLVTVREGGVPLFGYVKGAVVKNLNIYGARIAGYGLVDHLEGVGLSGEAILIDNVTLKSGTQTLKSGLIGTYLTDNQYAGCQNNFCVTIRNCTAEKDVVIGYDKDQSMIGSFAGRINGTIENCVSHAAVYGKEYVGGILGTRDNSLGTCAVSDCTFDGTVEASDMYAGGIVGGGYCNGSGTNSIKVDVSDCTVKGTVNGTDRVGGIVGGDGNVVQLWYAHTLKNNSFSGTVRATEGTAAGGIIGYYASLNKFDDIAGNLYTGADCGIGFVQYIDTSCETHETESGAVYINTAEGKPNIKGITKTGHNRTDDPLGEDASKLCYTDSTPATPKELVVSGNYKDEYIKGENLDLSGIILSVSYTNGHSETISIGDVDITGFDSEKIGSQEITLSYRGLTATIRVQVSNEEGEITVTVSILGDILHDCEADGKIHTFVDGNLNIWVPEKEYTVSPDSTVLDVLNSIFAPNGITASNPSGNYIESLTKDDVTIGELTNGKNSGWIFTVNGIYGDKGVSEQYLANGDKIVFHYTDDYIRDKESIGGTTNPQPGDQTGGDTTGDGTTDPQPGDQTGGNTTGDGTTDPQPSDQTGGNTTGNGTTGPKPGNQTDGNTAGNGTSAGDDASDKTSDACKITLSKTSYTYNGKFQKPGVTVKNSAGKKLKSGTDYTVTYPKSMKNVGKYTVTVKLKGSYSGTLKADFEIIPKSTSISKLTANKKGFTVKWKKQADQTTGYEIVYSTNKKFPKKDTKAITIKKNNTVSRKVTKLKTKKKYYVRIRTYKTVKVNKKSTKIYSSWSKVNSVTTK